MVKGVVVMEVAAMAEVVTVGVGMEVAAPVAAGRAGAVMAEEAMAEEVMFRTRLLLFRKARLKGCTFWCRHRTFWCSSLS